MRSEKSTFETLYRALNPRQREAVDAIEGPVIVIAGPGTGKTQVLTLRIANILKRTDVGPEGILALTFTNSGVAAMRARLAEIIGSAAYRVNIYTFHGFANAVIQRFPEYFPRIIGSRTADRIDSLRLVERAVLARRLKAIKPFGNPLYYVSSIVKAIETLKRENMPPSAFAALLRTTVDRAANPKKYERNRELALVYRAYEEALKRERLYDYGDMIMELVRVLVAERELLLTLEEEYQYILADEHQDANQAQNTILELLGSFHDEPNLFIVGDEKQAIYQFQGASLHNFLYFTARFPNAKIIELSENYRSTQNILDAAHSLALSAKERLSHVRLKAQKQRRQKESVILAPVPRSGDEPDYVASEVEKLIGKGTNPGDIAMLYRENSDMPPFAAALAARGIPSVIGSETDVLKTPALAELLILMRGAVHMDDDRKLAELLCLPLTGIPAHLRYMLLARAAETHMSLYLVLARATEPPACAFSRRLSHLNAVSLTRMLPASIDFLVNESGYREEVIAGDDPTGTIQKLGDFFAEVKRYSARHPDHKLADFLDYLSALETHGLSIPERAEGRGGVRLMTAHGSKGLEFDYVFIVRAFHGHFGGRRVRERFDLPMRGSALREEIGVDDERRLFYVALTRSRRRVTVSYSVSDDNGGTLLPSQFISEIDSRLVKLASIPEKKVPQALTSVSYQIAAPRPVPDAEYLKALFFERGFSVTHLNNYLACPWKYFFVNLLRIPEAKSKHLIYGSAMHAALKELYDRGSRGERVSAARIIRIFEENIARAPLSPLEREEALGKGKRSLSGYIAQHRAGLPKDIRIEYAIHGVPFPLEGESHVVRLNGILDRITFVSDGVLVSDYKTGAHKSRNEIVGKTKRADGNYWRQLVFYKLLLDEQGTFKMREGEIAFVEPDEKGRYRTERFSVTPEDVSLLTRTMQEVLRAIASLSFWDQTCSDPDCEYCRLAKVIKKS